MNEHPRQNWLFRRKVDWTLIFGILGSLGAGIAFSAKAVAMHSRWMDKVDRVIQLEPVIAEHAKKIDATQIQYNYILEELKSINKKIGR